MAKSLNTNQFISKVSNLFHFNGGNPPKNKVERGLDENKLPFVRKVDHITRANGRTLRYHPTKGWKLVQEYSPHIFLNSIWIKAGFNSLY